MKRCLLILADGARADVMKDLLEAGKLPAIGEYLTVSREAVTSFPSTTGPAYLPFLTGCYPGTCNIPGIRWFDKDLFATSLFSQRRFRSYVGAESLYMNSDMTREKKLLFELIPRSVNIFSNINRGVRFRNNKTKFSRIWYCYYSHLTDHWGIIDQAAEKKTLRALKEDPEFIFAVFPGIDEFSHLSSPFHPRTLEAYQTLDRAVGEIVASLKKEGKWAETAMFIVSDHGLSETQKHLPLNQFLEGNGISTFYYPKILKWGFQAASMVSGNAMANLYFKNGQSWRGRTTWESLVSRKDRIMDRLQDRPEIGLMAAQREDGAVVVKSQKGEAVISTVGAPLGAPTRTQQAASLRYQVIGSDPFGYGMLPSTMTDRESLEKTMATDYPDALAQLLQIFRSSRAGDLILSASKGNDLRQRHEIHEHKSSHGSLYREHMRIPLLTNLPLPERPFRSADVFPTILQFLDRPVPAGIDGCA